METKTEDPRWEGYEFERAIFNLARLIFWKNYALYCESKDETKNKAGI